MSIPHRDSRQQTSTSSPQNFSDEPPWSPSLLEAIQEERRCYLVADKADAERMTAYGLLTLDIPAVEHLTLDILKPLSYINVLQRPGDTQFGVAVRRRLVEMGWHGCFNRGFLLDVLPNTAAVERHCGGDKEQFVLWILGAFDPTLQERLGPSPKQPKGKQARRKEPRPLIINADEVEAQEMQWLWSPYIPLGMLVMLDGDPGLGKSLMLLQVATNLSKRLPFLDQFGKPTIFPDIDGPQNTLILSAEDSLSHVMIPRLKRAGAELSRIKFLPGWLGPNDEEHAFNLEHLPMLVKAIEHVKPALVILDPLVAYLGNIDMHRSNETRPLMAALGKMAERYGCTILGVRHPSKMDQGGRLMYRGQGNMDIIGAARSGLWVQPHPTHPETETIMIHSKSNVGILGRTVIFSREKGEFTWKGVSRLAESVLTGKGPDPIAMLEAFFWLEEKMTPNIPYKSADIEDEAEKKDISLKILKRAKKLLGVKSSQRDDGWYCFLPSL